MRRFASVLAFMSRAHMASENPVPYTEYLTPGQVAAILQVSTDTVAREFGNAEGVIDLGTPESRRKRRKRVLRIPPRTLQRFIAEKLVRARS